MGTGFAVVLADDSVGASNPVTRAIIPELDATKPHPMERGNLTSKINKCRTATASIVFITHGGATDVFNMRNAPRSLGALEIPSVRRLRECL